MGQVTLPHYEAFDYTVSENLADQTNWMGANTGDNILIAAGNLDVAGLQASTGNKVSFSGGGIDHILECTSQSTGKVFYSFAIKVTDVASATSGNGGYLSGLASSNTNYGATFWLKKDGTQYVIGLNRKTSPGQTQFTTTKYNVDDVVYIVGRYDLDTDEAKLWVNPSSGDFGSGSAPSETLTASMGSTLSSINRFFLRQDSNSETPAVEIDEVRIGTAWADVTPPAAGSSNTSVSFASASASVEESGATYDLLVSINNEDEFNATTANVVLTSGEAADINSYTTQLVTFPAGSSADQMVTLTITDDALEEGNETLTLELQSVAGGNSAAAGSPSTFELTINDNDGQAIIFNEVEYFGTDQVELKNIGTESVDISGYYLCSEMAYGALTGLTVSDTDLAPGEIALISGFALNDVDADLGLYKNNSDFGLAANMEAFVQWGAAGNGRESVANTKGIWTTGDFIPTVAASGSTIEYDGEGFASSDWIEQTVSTLNAENSLIRTASDLAGARSLGLGADLRISGEVVISFQGNSADKIYIQDASGGLLIDDNETINTVYSVGDGIINLTGTLVDGNGVMELVPATDPGAANSTGNTITPLEVAIATFKSSIDTYENRVIKIVDVSFDDAGTTFSNFSNFNFTDGTDELVFRPNFSDPDFSTTEVPYGQVDVVAIAGEFRGSAQAIPYSNTEFADDAYAPLFTVVPATSNVTSSSFDVTFQSDEPGTVYYTVDRNVTAPSIPTILAGTSMAYTDVAAEVTINIGSLSGATQYYVHIVAADDEGTPNEQSAATTVTATTFNNDGDSDITAVAAGETSNINYSSFQDAATLTTGNSVSLFAFSINDKATTDMVSTIVTGISFDITNHENLRTLALFEGTNTTSTAELDVAGNISTNTVAFSRLNLEAATGGTLEVTVRATFLNAVDDEEQIQLTISNAIADGVGSSFAMANAGGAASDISTTDLNAIAVTATLFDIVAPTSVAPATDFTVTATAQDANGNTDIAARNVTLSGNAGTGTLSSAGGLGPVAMTNGIYSWADAQHDTEETITVDVTDEAITSTSGNINISTITGGVFISEYIEGSSNNKAIEVFNNTGSLINLSEYKLGLYSNGSPTIGNNITLSAIAATLADGEVVVVSNANAADANILAESDTTSAITFYNGNDAVALLKNDVVIDVIGEIGNNPGRGWDVAGTTDATVDHTLVRKSSVTEGNPTNLASFGTNISNSEWEVFDQDATSNLGSHTVDVVGDPLITFDAASFGGDFGGVTESTMSSSSSFMVSGSDLTEDITVTASAGFAVSLDDMTFTSSIMLTQTGGTVSSTVVHARFEPTAVQAYAGDITLTSTGANNKTIAVSGAGLSAATIFYEGFSTCPSTSMVVFSVLSDQDWRCTVNGNNDNAMEIVGFGADTLSDEWLITPVVDLASATHSTLTFYSWTQFTDTTHPTIAVMVSSDYSGSGDPTSATWTKLSALFAAQDSQTWTASGDIDLSSFGESVYIGFHFTSSGTTSGTVANWRIDDILIEDRMPVANPSFTITGSLADFGTVDKGSVSISQSFTVDGADLTADISVTAPSSFEVSLDNAMFTSSVNLVHTGGALASTPVHVRFAPASGANGAVTGDITLSTASANDQMVAVSGTEAGNTAIMNDLFFSEYIEPNGGNEKAIEIYNGTGVNVDLSAYMVRSSHNGLGFGNDGNEYDLPLTGTVADGEVFVVRNGDATDSTILAEGDLVVTHGEANGGSVASYTGDDALGLFKNGTLIDLIGDPDNRPTDGWDVAGVPAGTFNHTLVRKSSISTGNITPLGSFGTSPADSEWEVLDENTFSNLGSHTAVDPVDAGFTLTTDNFDGEFGSVAVGASSEASSYIVAGAEITGDFTITIPVGFEASLTSDFTNVVGTSSLPLSITPSGGTIDNVNVYVRFKPSADGAATGNLVHMAAGYPAVNLAVTGTGTAVTGLEELAKHNISVYPNPVQGVLNISIPDLFGAGDLRIVSIDGFVVLKAAIGTGNQIETSHLRSGVYLLQITNKETVVNHTIMVR